MKFGIYYAYWEKEWGGDFLPYIRRVKELGFDVLEVACGAFDKEPKAYFRTLRQEAARCGIELTGGYGPRPEHHLASTDQEAVEKAFAFYEDMFQKMEIAGIRSLGGALYSYWPVDYTKPIDKTADLRRSIPALQRLGDRAAEYGITLCMEALNRFEGYLLNTAAETAAYVQAVGRDNVNIMLDTFHMNIEEDNLVDAIRLAGEKLGELHVGEGNRRPPRPGRMNWKSILQALVDIGFDGPVVMEPFVQMGGQVGRDIKIFRDLSDGAGKKRLDADVKESVVYLRGLLQEIGQ